MAIAEYLRDCGYHVVEAANGDEAISVLTAADCEIDLILSDVQMPGTVDGFALARWVRQNMPGLEIILTSGYAGAARNPWSSASKRILSRSPSSSIGFWIGSSNHSPAGRVTSDRLIALPRDCPN